MMLVRRLARPLLAGFFVARGIRLLRSPAEGIPAAEKVGVPLAEKSGFLPTDAATLVRINAGIQTGAGLLLAIGRFPRLSALALAGSALPTAVARHPFWERKDAEERAAEQAALLSELSIVGGLLIAAADTAGDPSLAWRARHAAKNTRRATKHVVSASRRDAKLATKAATGSVKAKAASARNLLPV